MFFKQTLHNFFTSVCRRIVEIFSLWPCLQTNATVRFIFFLFFHQLFLLQTIPQWLGTFSITYGIAMFFLRLFLDLWQFLDFPYVFFFVVVVLCVRRSLQRFCGLDKNDTVKSASVVSSHTNGRLKLVHIYTENIAESTESVWNSVCMWFLVINSRICDFFFTQHTQFKLHIIFSTLRNFRRIFFVLFYSSSFLPCLFLVSIGFDSFNSFSSNSVA